MIQVTVFIIQILILPKNSLIVLLQRLQIVR